MCFKPEDLTQTITLSAQQNTVNIHFHHSIDSLLGSITFYRYRLNDAPWSPLTKLPQVIFQNLDHGTYRFEIKTVKNGFESPVKSFSFRIKPILWLQWQFWLASLILATSTILYLFSKQRKIHQQELTLIEQTNVVESMGKEKDILQMQAIVNQLNPHFINNALQWLQVRVDDDAEAVKVIGKLSENISTVFRHSRNKINYHNLKDEINLTENYLFIQKCRFGDRLQISLPNLLTWSKLGTINVPLMIIQIHAENAIEHGIRNKDDGRGTLTIEVIETETHLRILIRDDGVGRAVAARIGSLGTQNGTKMLKELEHILNKINTFKLSQIYHDGIYTDENGEKYGTCVELMIPKVFNYEL